MEVGELMCFRVAEFLILMSLEERGDSPILIPEREPEDSDYRQAYVSLYQRHLIERKGERLVLSEEARAWTGLRSRRTCALITAGNRRALLYPGKDQDILLELVETVFQDGSYRLQAMTDQGFALWLEESGCFPKPSLADKDMEELKGLFQDILKDVSERETARIECYRGNKRRARWRLKRAQGLPVLERLTDQSREVRFYTSEALTWMLEDIRKVEES